MGFGHSAVGIKPAEQRSIDGARIFFDTIALFGGSLRFFDGQGFIGHQVSEVRDPLVGPTDAAP